MAFFRHAKIASNPFPTCRHHIVRCVGYKKVPAALCSVLRNSLLNIKSTLFPKREKNHPLFPVAAHNLL